MPRTIETLRAETDRLHREAWERAQANPQPSPAQILAARIRALRAEQEERPR